jgi:peptidyl-tRNA hydrolase
MYCIVSREALKLMGGNRGKLGTQCGHGYLHCFWNAEERFPERAREYKDSLYNGTRAYKITLVTDTTAELIALHEYYSSNFGVALVTDQEYTVFKEPTITVLAIGPIYSDERCEILTNLKPLI